MRHVEELKARIASLDETLARACLVQVLVDLDAHWAKEHGDESPTGDLGAGLFEYLDGVVQRAATT